MQMSLSDGDELYREAAVGCTAGGSYQQQQALQQHN